MSFKDVLIDNGKSWLYGIGIAGMIVLTECVILWLCSMYIIDYDNLAVTLIISLIITASIPVVGCWIVLSYIEYRKENENGN